MTTRWTAALVGLAMAGSAQAVVVSTVGGFEYELLDFSGKPNSALNPAGCGMVGSGSSRDYRCDPMLFTDTTGGRIGGDLSVSSPGSAVVYENLDRNGSQYGLGVVQSGNTSDRWVSATEILTLTFEDAVNLVGYHVYNTSGKSNNSSFGSFQISKNYDPNHPSDAMWSGNLSFREVVFGPSGSGTNVNWFTDSNTFSFRAVGDSKFYLGAVKVTSAIPEPETYALMLAGLGLVGFVARRRRPKQ